MGPKLWNSSENVEFTVDKERNTGDKLSGKKKKTPFQQSYLDFS